MVSGSGAGLDCSGGCAFSMQGFLAGRAAQRAAIAFSFDDGGNRASGVAAFRKD